MDSLKLDTSSAALILVDLQRGIVGMPTSPYSGSFVVEKGASLAAAFRRMYPTVVYVRVDLSNMMSISVNLSHGDTTSILFEFSHIHVQSDGSSVALIGPENGR
jgi:hypothetical protein